MTRFMAVRISTGSNPAPASAVRAFAMAITSAAETPWPVTSPTMKATRSSVRGK